MAKCTTTIEQVKKDSLKYLGVVLSDDISAASIPALIAKDETYAQYLNNMDEPIDTAIMRMVDVGALPLKTVRIEYKDVYEEGISTNGRNMFISVETLLPTCREIKKIDFYAAMGGLYPDIDYGTVGTSDIVLPILRKGEQYVLHYSYIPERVSPFMSLSETAKQWKAKCEAEGLELETGEGAYNKNVLDIPDDLANLIQYYVFGALYIHDEPTVAMYQGTNKFEAYLSQYVPAEHVKNNKIINIFGGLN